RKGSGAIRFQLTNRFNRSRSAGPFHLAFVPKGSFTEIFFEVGFFNLAKSGADSRGGTIVHEISHQSTFNPTVDSDVTGDGKPDYGVSNAEQLARARSNVARHTADNFEYFAEDVLFGIK
ncbi:M35 family metallo-endopeptidase, partial [Bradyrhizobium diazoefficiens]